MTLSGCDTKEAAIAKLLEAGAKNLILTEGKNGAGCYNKDGCITAPSFPVKAVDTTGAGDTFAAALQAAVLEGRSFVECGAFANAAASLCVEQLGATTAAMDRAEIERRFRYILSCV
jgi:ribokinase